MKGDIELFNKIEAYLKGEMSPTEHAEFDELRKNNPELDHQVVAHHNFVSQLTEYGSRHQLKADMEDIHSQLDIAAIESEVVPNTVQVKKMWGKYRFDLAIAASVAILAVLSTLLSTGFFASDKNTSNYSALRREINSLKRSQNALIQNINDKPAHGPTNPGQFGGTGFALTANGYVVTNYHVIEGADSVYIQNSAGESYKVKTVYADPVYDLALLQITDSAFKPFNSVPYSIKKNTSDLGEEIYTVGFPKDDIVFSKGSLSSKTGYDGDTTAYQIDMNVNPGNSGGPLFDNRGNVVGVIKGKQLKYDGAAFAIKSGFLLKALEAIPQDSLTEKLTLSKKNSLTGLSRVEQVKKMRDYIFIVKVY
ncbi:MAG: trypsin-like peptidase protein [Sphingobacteriaceae bacterium]|jgi:S1-C subfamily serine protease|nr:trypsin-like peptidase protein [Sphingobacteriaceae bacterium]